MDQGLIEGIELGTCNESERLMGIRFNNDIISQIVSGLSSEPEHGEEDEEVEG